MVSLNFFDRASKKTLVNALLRSTSRFGSSSRMAWIAIIFHQFRGFWLGIVTSVLNLHKCSEGHVFEFLQCIFEIFFVNSLFAFAWYDRLVYITIFSFYLRYVPLFSTICHDFCLWIPSILPKPPQHDHQDHT